MTKPTTRRTILSSTFSRFPLLAVVGFGFLVSANIQAQTTNVYWDGAGTGTYGGTGSLNPTVARFSTNGPGGAGPYVGPSNSLFILNFGGATGVVTQSGNTTSSGMNWLSSGYVFSVGSANARRLEGTNNGDMYITNNANLTILGTNSSLTLRSMNIIGGAGSSVTLSNPTGTKLDLQFGDSSTNSGKTNSVDTIISGAGTVALGTSGNAGFVQSGNITNNTTGVLILSNTASGNFTFSGAISGTGAVVLTNSSSGTFFLTASNSYSGGTTIYQVNSSAILAISSSAAFGSGPVTIAGLGTNYIRNYSNNIILTNAIAITNGSVLRVATTNTGWKGTYSGVISGGGGIITRYTDTQIFANTNNSFGGGINIASGTKIVVGSLGMSGANSSLGTNGVITLSSDTGSGAAGEIYWLGTNSEVSDKTFALTTVSSSANAGLKIYAGTNSSGGTNVTLTLSGNIISTGTSNLTITLGTFNSNTLAMNGTINQTAGYTNSLIVTNNDASGTVVLSGNNSYGGNTTISNGTLTLNGVNTGAGTMQMKAPCVLKLGNTNALVNGFLAGASSSSNAPTVNLTMGGLHTVGGYGTASDEGWNMNFTNSSGQDATLTFTAPTNIITASSSTSGGRSITNQSANLTLIFNGAVDIGGSTDAVGATFTGPGNFSILGSLFSTNTNNSRTLTKSGSGTLTLSASNSYNGITTISAGALVLNAAGALGTNNLTLSGTLRTTAAGTNESKGNLTVTGNSTIDLGTNPGGRLIFASATGWTAGRTLTVTNSSGGAQLYILNTSGLDTNQIKSAENPTASASFDQNGLLTFSAAKTTPTITQNPTAGSIAYGQTLANSMLSGGTASVAGTFAFTTPSTAPSVGTSSQGVTFTPTDTANYNTVTTTVNVTVNKATPTITLAPTAGSITYGQTLANSILSGGTASVAGTFAFTTPSTAPSVGTSSQGVTFTPTDTANYNTVTTTVSVTVNNAGPTLTDSYPGSTPLGINPQNGLTYLMSYALGGDSSNAPTLPSQVNENGKLALVAVVRTNDTNVSVVGEAVVGLADYANSNLITPVIGTSSNVDQTYLPAGCERRKYSVDQGTNERQFLRLKAIQQ